MKLLIKLTLVANLLFSAAAVHAEVPSLKIQMVQQVPSLKISGGVGNEYLILYSDNLQVWNVLDRVKISESPTLYTDHSAGNEARRFYKLHTSDGLPIIKGISKSETVNEVEIAGESETGIFEIEVQVTAFEDDVWIPNSVDEAGESLAGFTFNITSSGTVFSGNVNASIVDDTADTESNGRFKISEGSSERFTVRVELKTSGAAAGKPFGIELQKINFASSASAELIGFMIPDDQEYETRKKVIK